MSNDYRNESRRRPPLEKYGTPGTQYPTPNPYDVVITEEVTSRAQVFEPVLYGTPHPTVPAALLCFQGPVKGGNTDKAPVRIYANPRLAQDAYNLISGDDEANDPLFPVFVRSYLLPRGYTKAVMGSALTALIGLTLSAGGNGYGTELETSGYGKVALGFAGGGGGGAAGWAEVAAGVIVAVVLTHCGTGYTTAPSVSVAGGEGASIVAVLQPTTARLANEVEQPAEDPFGGLYVRVNRTWETLPGKVVVMSSFYDEKTGSMFTKTRQKKLATDITPGTSYVPDESVTTVSREGIDGLFAYEVVETITQSVYFDETTAKAKDQMLPYQFKGRINIGDVDRLGTAVGHKTPESDTVLHTTLSWWVIAETKPVFTFDEMAPDDVVINDVSYRSVLHNETTRVYNGSPVTIPATVPSYSNYTGITEMLFPTGSIVPSGDYPWVGTLRRIRGGVENDGHPNRWRYDATVVEMR